MFHFSLMVVNTGGNHADLNDDYAAIKNEMKGVAQALGTSTLRELAYDRVLRSIPALRSKVNDRAILRALHFFRDDKRVADQVAALERGSFAEFLDLVVESGNSSWMLCQNCYPPGRFEEQGLSIALAASEEILKGCGAWRVHGGGFAGTIQAFVPDDLRDRYVETMTGIFGKRSCHELMIRSSGAKKLQLE